MKIKLKTLMPLCTMLATSGFVLSAQAIPITGNLSLSGTLSMDGTSFLTATKFTSFEDVTVGGASALSGAYIGTSGAAVTVTPFTWSPPTASTPISPLWTFVSGGNTYSFDLSVFHVDYASPDSLLLSGLGTAYVTGSGLDYTATTGTWDFSAQSQGLATFTYSSTTVIPNSSVPDGGSTVVMMGVSLIGLGLMGRKQK